jgi:hypothetical protein
MVAYRDHTASLAPGVAATFRARPDMVANHIVVVDGRVVGGWRRLAARTSMIVETAVVGRFGAAERAALRAAAARFQAFLGVPVKLHARASGRMRP